MKFLKTLLIIFILTFSMQFVVEGIHNAKSSETNSVLPYLEFKYLNSDSDGIYEHIQVIIEFDVLGGINYEVYLYANTTGNQSFVFEDDFFSNFYLGVVYLTTKSVAYFLYKEELIALAESEGKTISPTSLSIRSAVQTIGLAKVIEEVGMVKLVDSLSKEDKKKLRKPLK